MTRPSFVEGEIVQTELSAETDRNGFTDIGNPIVCYQTQDNDDTLTYSLGGDRCGCVFSINQELTGQLKTKETAGL